MTAHEVRSQRESRRFDLSATLQTVQVPTDPSHVGVPNARRRVCKVWLKHGLEAFLEFDADRVVKTSELSLGVLDAAGELGVLGKPSMAESNIDFEFGDTVLGSGDPAIDVLER